jgi:hypothetical protein
MIDSATVNGPRRAARSCQKKQSALHVQLELERWQRGEIPVPTKPPSAGKPLTLITSVSASDEGEKV